MTWDEINDAIHSEFDNHLKELRETAWERINIEVPDLPGTCKICGPSVAKWQGTEYLCQRCHSDKWFTFDSEPAKIVAIEALKEVRDKSLSVARHYFAMQRLCQVAGCFQQQ